MVNRVTLIGRLGKDPEIRTYDNGTMVARFTLATSENYKDKNDQWQEITEWHNVIMWRQMAERAEKVLKKGSLVYIDGKLTHRSWQDQEGNTRYVTEVRANSFKPLEKRDSNSYNNPAPADKYANSNNNQATPATTAPKTAEVLDEDDADDLPF